MLDHLAKLAVASCAFVSIATPGMERHATDSPWTSIDLDNLAQFATREATIVPAPERGRGVVRVAAIEDRPAMFEYPEIGRQACDNCTFAYLKDVTFDNGIIEVDINGRRTNEGEKEQKGFSGLVFNLDPALRRWESVYFRPHNAVDRGHEAKAVQYVRMPGENWFSLRGGRVAIRNGKLQDITNYKEVDIEKGSRYEGAANGIAPGKWFTARIVIAGEKVAAFVRPEGASRFTRVLSVESLNKADVKGGIGFYTEPRNTAYFRHARYLRMSAGEAATWLAKEPK